MFDDEADFLPGFLDDAKLVFESGGGNVPFQMLSEHFWDDLNSVFAKDVGEAWIAADPQNADPYALLGAHYAALDDESGIEKLLQNAETNGVDFNTIDAKIKTNSDGTCTLTVQINDFLKDESGQSASVSVKVDAKDNAKTVTQKVAEKAADSAASKVVEKSGLTGEAAGIANSMAQEALRKGLGSAGSGQGTESSGTVTAPTYDPSQDSGESDDFDWSQIQSEFDFDNGKGICGVAPNAKLYGVDWSDSPLYRTIDKKKPTFGDGSNLYCMKIAMLYLVVEKQCQVINISQSAFGVEVRCNASNNNDDAINVINKFNEEFASFLKYVRELSKMEFIICKYPAAVLPAEMNFCGPAGAKGIRWCFWTSAWRAPMALRRRSGCVRPTRTC